MGAVPEIYKGREPAWHSVATAIWGRDSRTTAAEAFDGMRYRVEKQPMFTKLPNGIEVPIPGQVVLMREPTSFDPNWAYLGTASDRYEVFQNEDIEKMLDPLTRPAHGSSTRYDPVLEPDVPADFPGWPVETIGTLFNGATLFVTLDAGETVIAGEDYARYLFCSDWKGNGQAFWVGITEIRQVCENTCILAMEAAKIKVKVSHTEGGWMEANFYTNLIAQLRGATVAVDAALERMAEIKVVMDEVDMVLKGIWPEPRVNGKVTLRDELAKAGKLPTNAGHLARLDDAKRLYEQEKERNEILRAITLEKFQKFNDEFPRLANTGYALYQGVTEVSTWREGRLAVQSLLTGDRRKEIEDASKLILKLA